MELSHIVHNHQSKMTRKTHNTSLTYIAFQSVKPSMMGVIKKIQDQARAMKDIFPGFRCFIIGNHEKNLLDGSGTDKYLGLMNIPVTPRSSIAKIFELRCKSIQAAESILSENPPSFLYMRYPLGCPWMMAFFKKCRSRNIKIVTEHQSFEIRELISQKKYHMALSEALFGKICLKLAYGSIGVTEEIARYEQKRAPGIKTICIPNGIDTSRYQLRNLISSDIDKRLDLLFVGAVSRWHGVDRLIHGIAQSGNKRIHLHIVGDASGTQALKTLVNQQNLEEQVLFHGFKTGKELDEMFDKCHIAVGSLGIHRKGLKETSDLKSREYCARGIPFFSSAFDADVSENFPFRLKVPADDSPIDMAHIMDFAKNVLADGGHPRKIKEFATAKLDWEIKVKNLECFLLTIMKSGKAG